MQTETAEYFREKAEQCRRLAGAVANQREPVVANLLALAVEIAAQAGPLATRIMPQWRMGDRVRWQDKTGHFHRDLGDGNAEVTIANRAYRVRIGDLRSG